MSTHVTQDTLDAAALGRLESSDLQGLDSHIRDCADCEHELQSTVAFVEKMRATRRVVKTAGGWTLQRPHSEPARVVSFPGRLAWAAVPVAAAAALAIFLLQGPSESAIPTFQFPASRTLVQVRSAGGVGTTLGSAFSAYNEGSFEEAVSRLRAAPTADGNAALVQLYLGSALALEDRHEQALAALNAVDGPNQLPEPLLSEWKFMRAISLWHTGDEAAARELIAELTDQAGDIGSRAREWQDRLSRSR